MATFVFRRCLSCNIGSVIPDGERDQKKHACKECKAVGKWDERAYDPHSRRALPGIAISIPDSGWSRENGGHGHYFSQLEDKPSTRRSAHAFCSSAREMKEKFARRGQKVTRDGF
jgi:hypothetical protein